MLLLVTSSYLTIDNHRSHAGHDKVVLCTSLKLLLDRNSRLRYNVIRNYNNALIYSPILYCYKTTYNRLRHAEICQTTCTTFVLKKI